MEEAVPAYTYPATKMEQTDPEPPTWTVSPSRRRHTSEKLPLARVIKVLPGKDGVVRVAEIRTKDGSYTRPVSRLLRLEDDIESPQGEGNVDNDS